MTLQRLTKAITTIIATISLIACTDIEDFTTDEQGNEVKLKITAGFDDQTRTKGNCWFVDSVGIFIKEQKSKSFYKDNENKTFFVQTRGIWQTTGELIQSNTNEDITIASNGKKYEVISYGPYTENYDNGTVTLDISNQRQHHIHDLLHADFITARRYGVDASNPNVALTFKHRFAKVKIRMYTSSGIMPMPTAGTIRNQFTKIKYDVADDDIKLDDGNGRQDIKMSWLTKYDDFHSASIPLEEEDNYLVDSGIDVNNKKGYLVLYAIVLPNNIEGNPATDRTIELKLCNGTTRSITIPASISFEPGNSYELTLKDYPEEEESTIKFTGYRWDVKKQMMYVDYEISNYIGREFGGGYYVRSGYEEREIIVDNPTYRKIKGTAKFDDFLPNMSYELSPFYFELAAHKVKIIDSKFKIATLTNIENTKWTIHINESRDENGSHYHEAGQWTFGKYNDSGMSTAIIKNTNGSYYSYSATEWCYDNNLRGYRIDCTDKYNNNSGAEWVINDVRREYTWCIKHDSSTEDVLSGYYRIWTINDYGEKEYGDKATFSLWPVHE